MFDIGWQELFIVAIFALIVVGPKDMPRVIRSVSQALKKVKGMAREFQSGIDDVVREAELADLKKEMEEEGESLKNNVAGDVDLTEELTGEYTEELDFSKEQLDLELAAKAEPEPAPEDAPVPSDSSEKKADG